jgi:uncharacterized membrane protein
MTASSTPKKHTNRHTRHRQCLFMANYCVVLGLTRVMFTFKPDDDNRMLVVYGIACILACFVYSIAWMIHTALSEFPYSLDLVKQFFWTPACALFVLGCVIGGIALCTLTLDDTPGGTRDPDESVWAVISFFLISFWVVIVVLVERWRLSQPRNCHPVRGEDNKRDGTQASTQASTDTVAQV